MGFAPLFDEDIPFGPASECDENTDGTGVITIIGTSIESSLQYL